MASNPQLTKDWIQYLKNNQIVSMQSDPTTGRLNYKRKVTVDDISTFLRTATDYSDKEINNAINSVAKGNAPSNLPATHQPQPTEQPAQSSQQTEPKQKKYSTADVTDVEPRYGPRPALPAPQGEPQPSGQLSQTQDAIRKRKQREEAARKRKASARSFSQMATHLGGRVNEAMSDEPTPEIHEKDIEAIFSKLSAAGPPKSKTAGAKMPAVDPQSLRFDEINKIKRIIRDTMTEQQRMSLWRALSDA